MSWQRLNDQGPLTLPPHLHERSEQYGQRPVRRDGQFVLCWLHHAMRADENPVLDAAIVLACQLDKPLLVYFGLGGQHRFNNDRQFFFMLEGARNLARDLRRNGLNLRCFLPLEGQPSPITELMASSAAVVTELFPAPPMPRWLNAQAAATDTPVLRVDASCLVPMTRFEQAFTRAFAFRKTVSEQLEQAIGRDWPRLTEQARDYRGRLPFRPINLEKSLSGLVARCPIDHGVGPVSHSRGGSVAGYQRWQAFRQHGLADYHRNRNDAALNWSYGVSRLSPYLHHGHVSPFRIAREAAAEGGPGAEKFLDELLIWRELSWHFCHHCPDPDDFALALPDWAQQTLDQHSERPAELIDRERLARGQSGDTLWDLAQRSLLRHGELHNNLRMTWAKAIVPWRPDPRDALDTLIQLNHQFALDGNDPNSYGGLLWALGQFDRPFEPPKPVFGKVRARSTRGHAKRLDSQAFAEKVNRSPFSLRDPIAIIGAGVAGCAAARSLLDHGLPVTVFEKARGPGGRTATRRESGAGRQWDHGAQYLTLRDPRLQERARAWAEAGVIDRWQGRVGVIDQPGEIVDKASETDRWVAVPGMNALCKHVLADAPLRRELRIAKVVRRGVAWWLIDSEDEEHGPFGAVIITAPPAQSADMLPTNSPLRQRCEQASMSPCWALMVEFEQPLALQHEGLFINHGALSWAMHEASKPGREPGNRWLLHASAEWSEEHLEADPASVRDALLAAFAEAIGQPLPDNQHARAHRWRYAQGSLKDAPGCLWHGGSFLGVAGDWLHGQRVEGALLSGVAVAGRLMSSLHERRR